VISARISSLRDRKRAEITQARCSSNSGITRLVLAW
jgi:hypothetical protein